MFPKDVYKIFSLIANDKYVRTPAVGITFFTIFLAIFFSPLAALIVYGSYISGYIVCWCLIKYQSYASACVQEIISFCYTSNRRRKLKASCSICDDMSCKRHLQSKIISPWKHLHINKNLNDSIEHFFNRILETFIVSWYGEFTTDTDFINELRYCLKYASAMVVNRIEELDYAKIISQKLMPCVIKHIDDYLYMQQIVKLKNARMNDVIVEYLGRRLHVATSNRKNELGYLQHFSSSLIPHVLPNKYLGCKNYTVLIREILAGWVFLPLMDVLADPNILNLLVILGVTYKSKKINKNKCIVEDVEFLGSFIKDYKEKSSFATDLNNIKSNTELLYAFMQFLKREEHVHLLQFCLDVDEFNNKLLTPELSKKELEDLHSEALVLYKEYLNKDSVNFVGCSQEIILEFYSLIKDGVYSVAKLRTSKPLFQAYEHTFNVLENVWLPAFFHSNEFYGHICGSKLTTGYNRQCTSSRAHKYGDVSSGLSTVAKISSGLGKIRGALKTVQPIEGAIFPIEPPNIENGNVEDIIISECGNIFRDLSAWRVSILSYQTTNKIVSFCINVQRLDAVEDGGRRHWVVSRKDQDFFTLKAKLVEFHGESEISDSPLPFRKAGSSIDVRMSKYEDFLKKLLQKPSLRGSDLLYTFLTCEDEFTQVITMTAQNVQDIGNIYQSVAHRLRKERGQSLDSFMATFLGSTAKTKSGKFECTEVGDEADWKTSPRPRSLPSPKTFRNHVFNDNFGITYKATKESSGSSFNPSGLSHSVFYLLKYIFKVPHCLLKLYAAFCTVAQDLVETFSGVIIERKLKSAVSSANLTYLIKLLEDVIFETHVSPTSQELEQRRKRAFQELSTLIPSYTDKIIGSQFSAGLATLLEILQHPHYNKQLAYNLLDLIALEMYPTLGQA